MDSCPKCGAGEYCRDAGNCAVIYDCNSTLTRQGFRSESIDCLRRQLAAMTARAEKAEAEVARLREAIRVRDGFARYMGWVSTCTYCGGRSTHHTDCPTITHPVEVEP